jgi:hypothetical protein
MAIRRTWPRAALALGVLAVGSLPASAALSPLHESIREIQTILEDPRLAAAFRDQLPIISITVKSQDVFEFASPSCKVDVKVVDVSPTPKIVGGRQFRLEFGEATCK